MQLYELSYGKSKKRMRPIMVDTKAKCENYKRSREPNVTGWHDIKPAAPDAVVWRQKGSTVLGNKDLRGPARINRHGVDQVAGYIGKNGFNAHT